MKKLTLFIGALMIAGAAFAHDGKGACCKNHKDCKKEAKCCHKKNCPNNKSADNKSKKS